MGIHQWVGLIAGATSSSTADDRMDSAGSVSRRWGSRGSVYEGGRCSRAKTFASWSEAAMAVKNVPIARKESSNKHLP